MVKRVTALEDQIEKMNEKQDRMLDLLDKIGKKIKINEEDKKIELPTPPSALTNQQTYSNAQLNDFIDQVKSTPNMPHTAQTQQHPVITQFARIPPAQPHNTIQSNQSTYRSSVISSPHTYSNMNNTSNSVSTNQDNYQILEDIRRQLNIGNIPHNIGSSPHIQHPTSHSLSSSHFQGSNGNSVGSSTPIQRQQNTQPPNQIPSNVANEEYLNKHYQMIKLQMELGMIPPRHQSYTQEGYGQE